MLHYLEAIERCILQALSIESYVALNLESAQARRLGSLSAL
jgi:hypothetical protein